MARRSTTNKERLQRKHVKRLGDLNYTPQAARLLTSILWALAEEPSIHASSVLTAFGRIVDEARKQAITTKRQVT